MKDPNWPPPGRMGAKAARPHRQGDRVNRKKLNATIIGTTLALCCCGGGIAAFGGGDDKPTPAVTSAAPTRGAVNTVPSASPTRSPSPKPTPSKTSARPSPKPTTKRPTTRAPEPEYTQRGVHPGAYCSTRGAYGLTSDGTLMRCKTSATDSRLRWRRA